MNLPGVCCVLDGIAMFPSCSGVCCVLDGPLHCRSTLCDWKLMLNFWGGNDFCAVESSRNGIGSFPSSNSPGYVLAEVGTLSSILFARSRKLLRFQVVAFWSPTKSSSFNSSAYSLAPSHTTFVQPLRPIVPELSQYFTIRCTCTSFWIPLQGLWRHVVILAGNFRDFVLFHLTSSPSPSLRFSFVLQWICMEVLFTLLFVIVVLVFRKDLCRREMRRSRTNHQTCSCEKPGFRRCRIWFVRYLCFWVSSYWYTNASMH
jgi:hypothetical protein